MSQDIFNPFSSMQLKYQVFPLASKVNKKSKTHPKEKMNIYTVASPNHIST